MAGSGSGPACREEAARVGAAAPAHGQGSAGRVAEGRAHAAGAGHQRLPAVLLALHQRLGLGRRQGQRQPTSVREL